jgi:hypothetical protein
MYSQEDEATMNPSRHSNGTRRKVGPRSHIAMAFFGRPARRLRTATQTTLEALGYAINEWIPLR